MPITAHCLVKNEEIFVSYAIRSIIDFVQTVIVFDTGSTDSTVSIINSLRQEYPGKIIFEEKGPCDKVRHTQLRQEMIDRTQTEWFLILDGDEVWTKRGVEEARQVMESDSRVSCIMAPFYLCVGDIFHRYYKSGQIEMLGKKDFFYPRLIKKINGVHWKGDYNEDTLYTDNNQIFFTIDNSHTLKNRFWHMTHLRRSWSDDTDYSSGGTRLLKRKLTYFFIGRKIKEPVPEVFGAHKTWRMGKIESFMQFVFLCLRAL